MIAANRSAADAVPSQLASAMNGDGGVRVGEGVGLGDPVNVGKSVRVCKGVALGIGDSVGDPVGPCALATDDIASSQTPEARNQNETNKPG